MTVRSDSHHFTGRTHFTLSGLRCTMRMNPIATSTRTGALPPMQADLDFVPPEFKSAMLAAGLRYLNFEPRCGVITRNQCFLCTTGRQASVTPSRPRVACLDFLTIAHQRV